MIETRSACSAWVTEEAEQEPDPGTDVSTPGPMSPRLWYARQEEAAKKRHERLVEQWKEIRRLYLVGMDLREICHELGVSVRTVYRYKDLAEPPPCRAYKRRARVLDPYVPYLVRHWNEGCHNGERLYREIREQGYAHLPHQRHQSISGVQARRCRGQTTILYSTCQERSRSRDASERP
jgi:hypothetical protein